MTEAAWTMSPPLVGTRARRYALLLLFCAYTINYVDRQVVTILQDAIKTDLHLTDTQLGLITGLSFALFYATLGVPIGRLGDIRSRKAIIVVSMTLWSAATSLCAAANSFVSLLVYRIGVGIGEAGLTPAAHSLISDYYEPRKRAGALSIYAASGTVGLMCGFLIGGWINHYFGWRIAILFAGGPGLLLALIIGLTMREPRRGQYDPVATDPTGAPPPSFGAALGALMRNRAFCWLALGCGLHTFVTYGHGNWTPPFLGRVHGMSSSELGTWLALFSVGPALIGILGAGYLADRLAERRPNARIEVALASIALMIPFEIGGLSAGGETGALALFAGSFFFGGAYLAPCIATAHGIVAPTTRASASALLMLSINLIGLGLGPLAVGMLSDHWQASGPEGLRQAMLAIIPVELLAIACLLRAKRLITPGQSRSAAPRPHEIRRGETARSAR